MITFKRFVPAVCFSALVLLCQCETVETASSETVQVVGVMHFPDESGKTYVIPAGSEVIGAGGTNCTYIVEPGGRLEAHSGNGNRYKVKEGGYFKGFIHPAENCVVQFSQRATLEQVEAGPGTTFSMVD